MVGWMLIEGWPRESKRVVPLASGVLLAPLPPVARSPTIWLS